MFTGASIHYLGGNPQKLQAFVCYVKSYHNCNRIRADGNVASRDQYQIQPYPGLKEELISDDEDDDQYDQYEPPMPRNRTQDTRSSGQGRIPVKSRPQVCARARARVCV